MAWLYSREGGLVFLLDEMLAPRLRVGGGRVNASRRRVETNTEDITTSGDDRQRNQGRQGQPAACARNIDTDHRDVCALPSRSIVCSWTIQSTAMSTSPGPRMPRPRASHLRLPMRGDSRHAIRQSDRRRPRAATSAAGLGPVDDSVVKLERISCYAISSALRLPRRRPVRPRSVAPLRQPDDADHALLGRRSGPSAYAIGLWIVCIATEGLEPARRGGSHAAVHST